MARPLRLEYADTFYHVLARGNERRAIYRDDGDRRHFLDLIGRFCERFEIEVWSYVLMPNHYHLVLRTGQANLSRAMQWLGVAYSVWHNRRHERSGHLFQGRFKGFIVDEEGYLDQLILYVHRNPVRAGVVERLADYPWSSYRCLAYGRGCCKWFGRSKALGLFRGDPARFRRAVRAYSEEKASLFEDLRQGLFLGGVEAFERLLARAQPGRHREKPQTRPIARPTSLKELVEGHGRALCLSAEALAAIRRPVRGCHRPLRDVLIYLAWVDGRFPLRTIGAYFNVGYTAVANARTRGGARLAADRRLRGKLARANDT